jgi:hypothetical protein
MKISLILRVIVLACAMVLIYVFFARAEINPACYSFKVVSPIWDAVGGLIFLSAAIFWPKIEGLLARF